MRLGNPDFRYSAKVGRSAEAAKGGWEENDNLKQLVGGPGPMVWRIQLAHLHATDSLSRMPLQPYRLWTLGIDAPNIIKTNASTVVMLSRVNSVHPNGWACEL